LTVQALGLLSSGSVEHRVRNFFCSSLFAHRSILAICPSGCKCGFASSGWIGDQYCPLHGVRLPRSGTASVKSQLWISSLLTGSPLDRFGKHIDVPTCL
jgi:hypothetical protein